MGMARGSWRWLATDSKKLTSRFPVWYVFYRNARKASSKRSGCVATFRRNSVKSVHPLFEPTVVGVHVLNVVNLADNPNARSQIDWSVGDADFPYSSTQSLAAVGTENSIACQQWLECRTDMFLVSLTQNKVGCASSTVTANQYDIM